jgi:16S rRNA (cytosine1402-N4)-methyltransferase
MEELIHRPVLKEEVIKWLNPQTDQDFIDATLGLGGLAETILKLTAPKGKLLAIDWDPESLDYAQGKLSNFGSRVHYYQGNFADLVRITEETHFPKARGIIFDLGLALWQFQDFKRGFSFLVDGPLDMRLNGASPLDAQTIVNRWTEKNLAQLFWDYSQERYSRRIARAIVLTRVKSPIKTTGQLVEVIRNSVPPVYFHQKTHFATRVFQALRIAVNHELDNLSQALEQVDQGLKNGGRVVVISYHSGEDRIVKNFFRNSSDFKILTKKPVIPLRQEILINKASRSAKLRCAEKVKKIIC